MQIGMKISDGENPSFSVYFLIGMRFRSIFISRWKRFFFLVDFSVDCWRTSRVCDTGRFNQLAFVPASNFQQETSRLANYKDLHKKFDVQL